MIGIVPILVGIGFRGTLLGSLSNLLGAKRRIFKLLDDGTKILRIPDSLLCLHPSETRCQRNTTLLQSVVEFAHNRLAIKLDLHLPLQILISERRREVLAAEGVLRHITIGT